MQVKRQKLEYFIFKRKGGAGNEFHQGLVYYSVNRWHYFIIRQCNAGRVEDYDHFVKLKINLSGKQDAFICYRCADGIYVWHGIIENGVYSDKIVEYNYVSMAKMGTPDQRILKKMYNYSSNLIYQDEDDWDVLLIKEKLLKSNDQLNYIATCKWPWYYKAKGEWIPEILKAYYKKYWWGDKIRKVKTYSACLI